MSETYSTTDNQVKNMPEKFLSGERTYETIERGLLLILPGELPPARFSDNPGNHHFCVLSMENPLRGISVEMQRRMALEIEKSKPFLKGRIKYVPSKEEVLAAEKKKNQANTLEKYKKTLGAGIFELNLNDKTVEQLCMLADEIGAVFLDKNGNTTLKNVIIKNIKEKLGAYAEPEVKKEVKVNSARLTNKKGSKNG
jgi:hypothetical protein